LDCKTQLLELVGQEMSNSWLFQIEVESLIDCGNTTKTFSVGPVGGGVSMAPRGAATVNPLIGRCNGSPS
jgi:hypothetical protein